MLAPHMKTYEISQKMHLDAYESANIRAASLSFAELSSQGNRCCDALIDHMDAMYWDEIGKAVVSKWAEDENIGSIGEVKMGDSNRFRFTIGGVALEIETDDTGVGNLYLNDSEYRFSETDIYILVLATEDSSAYLAGWAWKHDFDKAVFRFESPDTGKSRAIPSDRLRDMDMLAPLLRVVLRNSSAAIARIIEPEILRHIVENRTGSVFVSPLVVAHVDPHDGVYDVVAVFNSVENEEDLERFYLRHRIDCSYRYRDKDDCVVMVYNECENHEAALILSSLLVDQTFSVEPRDKGEFCS